MADLEVEASRWPTDWLGNPIDFEARPPIDEQDPEVQARCPAIFRKAAALCIRFAPKSGTHTRTFRTPDVTYQTKKGAAGLIVATTVFTGQTGKDGFTPNRAEVALAWRSAADRRLRTIMAVRPDRVICHAVRLMRAGANADLNYFGGVVDQLRGLDFSEHQQALDEAEQARRTAFVDTVAPPSLAAVMVDIRDANL